MPPMVMRDYRAQHAITLGGKILSQGKCEIHLDDSFLLVNGDRTNRIGYEQVESIHSLPGGLEINLHPEGTIRFGGMDGALVRPLFLHLSRLRGERWAELLRFVDGEPVDTLECKLRVGDGQEWEALVHVYPSGVVAMPFGEEPVQFPMHELVTIRMEPDYRLLCAGPGLSMVLYGCEPSALGRFQRAIEGAWHASKEETADLLAEVFPALEFAHLSKLTDILLRGRAAPKADLEATVPWLWERVEDIIKTSGRGRESYEYLRELAGDRLWFGIRRLREEVAEAPTKDEEPTAHPEEIEAPQEPEIPRDYLFWFLAGIASGGKQFLAVEVVAPAKGFATYVYRCPEAPAGEDAFAATASAISNAMIALNFFREPLYASQKDIDSGRFAMYKLAVRKLPYLRHARELFVGRAIHTTPGAWKKSLQDLLV